MYSQYKNYYYWLGFNISFITGRHAVNNNCIKPYKHEAIFVLYLFKDCNIENYLTGVTVSNLDLECICSFKVIKSQLTDYRSNI